MGSYRAALRTNIPPVLFFWTGIFPSGGVLLHSSGLSSVSESVPGGVWLSVGAQVQFVLQLCVSAQNDREGPLLRSRQDPPAPPLKSSSVRAKIQQ